MSAIITGSVFTDPHELATRLSPLRTEGRRLVTTNGCFDLLHAGHVQYLNEAAALGDMLVVGINSDAVVQALKGPSRPIQSEQDRAFVIASLRAVTCTLIFEESDPRAFLEILKPDIHVKGGDYSRDIIERPVVESHGGQIRILSFKQGRSTTDIVQKIRQMAD